MKITILDEDWESIRVYLEKDGRTKDQEYTRSLVNYIEKDFKLLVISPSQGFDAVYEYNSLFYFELDEEDPFTLVMNSVVLPIRFVNKKDIL
jgi:hypothetical protein